MQLQGIDAVTIGTESGKQIASATQDEASSFVPVLESVPEADATFKMALVIEGPVFKDGNKWRFSDGQSSFFADIEDRDFLARVDSGEPFAKNDILSVDLNIQQSRAGMKLNTTRKIIKVHEHREGKRQVPLALTLGDGI